MTAFGLPVPPAKRRWVRCSDFHDTNEYLLRMYQVTPPDHAMAGPAYQAALERIDHVMSIAERARSGTPSHGLGFAVVHDLDPAVCVTVFWWFQGVQLQHRSFRQTSPCKEWTEDRTLTAWDIVVMMDEWRLWKQWVVDGVVGEEDTRDVDYMSQRPDHGLV